MSWIITPLESDADLDDVLHIEDVSFTNPWTREMYLADRANTGVSYSFVAREEDGTAVGFCSFWRVLDELHINNLAVLPHRRRQGVASALLMHVLREGGSTGATRATLEVRRSNDVALTLYARFGFKVAGVRRSYYSNPVEDALVLWKEGLGPAAP